MGASTKMLGLFKPADTDLVDVTADIGNNMDKIDGQFDPANASAHTHDGTNSAKISHNNLNDLATGDPHTQYILKTDKGVGVATLTGGVLDSSQIPSISDTNIGNRTPDQTLAPASPGTGTITQIFSWLANRIKAITGGVNWWDAPATTLANANTHINSTSNPHNTTAAQVGALPTAGGTMTGNINFNNAVVTYFKDSGGHVITAFSPQSDDNFVFYVSDSAGGSHAIWSSKMNQASGSQDFHVNVPITSTVANGTAPFIVTSPTVVTNLNADAVDGIHAGAAGGTAANTLAQTDANGAVGRANALKDGGGAYRAATTPGGNGPNLVAVTDSANGAVGRANAVIDGGATPAARTATAPGGTTANSVAITDVNGRVGDSNKLAGQNPDTAATAYKIVQRDVNGRAQIGAPAASGDIARIDESWTSTEESLVIESALPVTGSEPTQIQGGFGPAVEFADAATQSVVFTRRWPFASTNLRMELLAAMDTSVAGNVQLQIGWQVNGGAVTNVAYTATNVASTTSIVTLDPGQIIAAASVPQNSMVTITISRLGGDAADTHTGKFRLYHTRLKRG